MKEITVFNLPPLSLYIHFPWCVRKCPYCDFNSHVSKKDLPHDDYVAALLRDLMNDCTYIQGREIQSMYLGGGTPSLLDGQSVHYLLKRIRQMVPIAADAEVTIEANPESVTLEKLDCYQQAGINRISIGIQSLQDVYLKRLGRVHSSETACQAIDTVVNQGFTNFNLDLMYGLPDQSNQAGIRDIEAALAFKPTHLSWYQLSLEPHTVFFRKPPLLPCEDRIMDLQTQGLKHLSQAGFMPYEISAFSQPGFECYHNNNYWTFGDYIGIGAGAHSKVTLSISNTRLRYFKLYNPSIYLSAKYFQKGCEKISADQLPFEFMLNSLRRYQPTERQLFEARTGLSWESLLSPLDKAADKGLIEWNHTQLRVTPFGRRFYNDLVTLFL